MSQKECGAFSAKPKKKEDAQALKSTTAKVVGAKSSNAKATNVKWDVEWDGKLAYTSKEATPQAKSDAKKLEVEWDVFHPRLPHQPRSLRPRNKSCDGLLSLEQLFGWS